MTLLRRVGVKRVLAAAVVLLIGVSAVWVYYAYALLLSPASLKALAGPQENYYWPAAQLEIAIHRTRTTLMLYGAGLADYDAVRTRFDIVRSKYSVAAMPSDATDIFQSSTTYHDALVQIGKALDALAPILQQGQGHPERAAAIVERMNVLDTPLRELIMAISDVEIAHRDDVYADLIGKRKVFFVSSLTILGLLLAIGILAFMLGIDRRHLAQQQRRAIQAQAEAVRARSAFLGMIGHELRTPLQSIVSVTDILLQRRFADKDAALIRRLAVKGLVGLLGGTIEVESAIGEGTRFSVKIPMQALARAVEPDGAPSANPALDGMRVLVVDDQDSGRESFADVLVSFGVHVDEASDAADALAALAETTYDAILLDIQMPGEDGISVARKVRSVPGPNRQSPIIAVSAYEATQLEPYIGSLFDQRLQKPVRISALNHALLDLFKH